MIPRFPLFKPIDLELKDELAGYLERYQPNTCELCLANLYIWLETDHASITLINDNLCVFLQPGIDTPYFLEPVGTNSLIETIASCLKHASRISRVSEQFLTRFNSENKFLNNYQVFELPDEFDYIYKVAALAELKGSKFHAKRNFIAQFKRKYPNFKCQNIEPAFKAAALSLFEKWAVMHKDVNITKVKTAMQKTALTNAFNYFDCCSFSGIYIEADGQILGFILGSPLNQDTFVIHFQYSLPEIPGVYQVLLQQFCVKLGSQFTYINLEQDLGMAGLRKMKLSYHPDHLQKKYDLLCAV